MFTLRIDTDNEAFASWPDCGHAEISRILRALATHLGDTDRDAGTLRDLNGNTVGRWEYDRD